MSKVNLANPVRFGLKWFVHLSWFSTTEEEILAVYESVVPTNTENFKTCPAMFTNMVVVKLVFRCQVISSS